MGHVPMTLPTRVKGFAPLHAPYKPRLARRFLGNLVHGNVVILLHSL